MKFDIRWNMADKKAAPPFPKSQILDYRRLKPAATMFYFSDRQSKIVHRQSAMIFSDLRLAFSKKVNGWLKNQGL
jgi:hypothetical protein